MTKEFNQEKFDVIVEVTSNIRWKQSNIDGIKTTIAEIEKGLLEIEDERNYDLHPQIEGSFKRLRLVWDYPYGSFSTILNKSEIKALLNAMLETNQNKLKVFTEELKELQKQFTEL